MNWQRKYTSNGIAYCQRGRGPKIVFLHGLGLRAECWAEQMTSLVDQFCVLMLDLPGHGESVAIKPSPSAASSNDLSSLTSPSNNAPSSALADTVARAVNRASVKTALTDPIAEALHELNVHSAVVVGHSLGALIAVELSYTHPALCAAVVPISVVFNRSEKACEAVQGRARQLQQLPADSERANAPISRWFGESPSGVDRDMAKRCREWILHTDIKGYAGAYFLFAHYPGFDLEKLNEARQPMLFVTGECDNNSTPAMSKALAAKVVNGQVLIVEHARHMLQLTHAQTINQALLNFAERCTIRQFNSENSDGKIDG